MEQKVFYINFQMENGEKISTPVYAREDILYVINKTLDNDSDPTIKELMNDIIRLHAILLGTDYKKGNIYIPNDYN